MKGNIISSVFKVGFVRQKEFYESSILSKLSAAKKKCLPVHVAFSIPDDKIISKPSGLNECNNLYHQNIETVLVITQVSI